MDMKRERKAFTLTELLVVTGIVGLLLYITLPALNRVRQAARHAVCQSNQKQIGSVIHTYGTDNRDRCPPSVGYIELGSPRTWLEPTTLVNYEFDGPRSASCYLHPYVDEAKVMYCPSAPRDYSYMQEAWDAGDGWDNPDRRRRWDALFGTYNFWWSYRGWLSEKKRVFAGPSQLDRRRGESRLLASCFFGKTPGPSQLMSVGDFVSSEPFKTSGKTPEYATASQLWYQLDGRGLRRGQIRIKLTAVYVDTHVESFSAAETTPLNVAMSPDGSRPFPSWLRGEIYLPDEATR